MPADIDAYQTLQVAPQAEDIVVEAAYRALAQRYRPDGEAPDEARMAEISRAYDLVRSPGARRRYDRLHHQLPVGPGVASAGTGSAGASGPAGATGLADSPLAGTRPTNGGAAAAMLDFGRYAGWSLKDLAKHDPDYLRWLARSSGGYRFRNQILQLLPDAARVARSY